MACCFLFLAVYNTIDCKSWRNESQRNASYHSIPESLGLGKHPQLRPTRRAAKDALVACNEILALEEKEKKKINRSRAAKARKKKEKEQAESNGGGNLQLNKGSQGGGSGGSGHQKPAANPKAEFPGNGQRLDTTKMTSGNGQRPDGTNMTSERMRLSEILSADDPRFKAGNSAIFGMGETDHAVEALMQCAKLDGTFKKQLKDNVWNLEETNKNIDKVTVVLNGGEYNIERFRGAPR